MDDSSRDDAPQFESNRLLDVLIVAGLLVPQVPVRSRKMAFFYFALCLFFGLITLLHVSGS